MKRKPMASLAVVTLLHFFTGISFAQSNSPWFYYYKGEKLPLQLNSSRVAVTLEVSADSVSPQTILRGSGINPLAVKEDNTVETLLPVNSRNAAIAGKKTFYSEISVPAMANADAYDRRLKTLNNAADVVKASPCFFSSTGKNIGLMNSFYVQLNELNDLPLLNSFAQKNEIEVTGQNKYMPDWYTLDCTKKTALNALEAANLFYESGLFKAAEPAFVYEDLTLGVDPQYNIQWGLKNTGQNAAQYAGIDIGAEQAWTITKGSSSIKIAIFDQGIEMTHPDLKANIYGTGYNAGTGKSPSQILGPHATAVAGIAGAVQNNSLGVSGVAPGCRLMSVSISMLSSDPPQAYADGINWAWKNGADVINNSWGGMNPSAILDNAITNALTKGRGGKGTIMVFAAGNSGEGVLYPANSNPLILAVGAASYCGERKSLSSCDGKAWESNYGPELDIMAPGVAIATTDRAGSAGYRPDDYYSAFSGTSAAAPFISGIAALMLSVNPALKVKEVNDIIEITGRKVRTDMYSYNLIADRPNGPWNNEMGHGLVDGYMSVLLAKPLGSFSCSPPEIITCSKSTKHSITVAWTKAENAITYSLEYKEATAADWTVVPLISGTSYTIKKLAPGKIYDIRIKTTCETTISDYTYSECSTSTKGNGGDDDEEDDEEGEENSRSIALQSRETEVKDTKAVLIYPNPADDHISLVISYKGNYTGIIADITGRPIKSFTGTATNLSLSVKQLPPGLYTVVITPKDGSAVQRASFIRR